MRPLTRAHTRSLGVLSAALGISAFACLSAASLGTGTVSTTPALSSILFGSHVSGQQGHAQFLVGVRLSVPATVTVRILNAHTHKILSTTTTSKPHRKGRVFVLVQATDSRGYQLLPGSYTVWIGARTPAGANAVPVTRPMTLKYTPPRGVFDAFTVPVTPELGLPSGQFIGALGTQAGATHGALQVGDVITSLNGIAVGNQNTFNRVIRGLPANTPIAVMAMRSGVSTPISTTITALPDWNPSGPFGSALAANVSSNKTKFAYAYAQAEYAIQTGDTTTANRISASWATQYPGTTDILKAQVAARLKQWAAASSDWANALTPNNMRGDPAIPFGIGVADNALGQPNPLAFVAAEAFDPSDATAFAYEALAWIQYGAPHPALAAARIARSLDSTSPDARAAFGLALIRTGNARSGLIVLKSAIVTTDDRSRAQLLINNYLEQANP